jgi:uncharacterized protein
MWYNRYFEYNYSDLMKHGKVLAVYGPRQCGKSSLIEKWLSAYQGRYFKGTGEDLPFRELMASQSKERILSAFSGYDLVFIDEAQKITDIGLGLKLLVDHRPDLVVIASGSSSFKLAQETGEPLTGRQRTLKLFPISMLELKNQFGAMEIVGKLDEFLVFGTYPETLRQANPADKIEFLRHLRDAYMLKDILEHDNIRNSGKLFDLLKLLAFQIGQEVSLNELGISLGMAKQTVERYLDLLEKTFVIIQVSGFSRNLRKEVTKTRRYYFLDNGLRNAVINNFNDLKTRDDVGRLFENFLFIERIKKQNYLRLFSDNYFWRTYEGKEVDLVEEREGRLYGYEFKWTAKGFKPPKLFLETYPNASLEVISRENMLDFIG